MSLQAKMGGDISMETIDVLAQYANRQVVVIEYMEGELLARDGYAFDHLAMDTDAIRIIRDGRTVAELKLDAGTSFERMTDFVRHYALEIGGRRTELYFP